MPAYISEAWEYYVPDDEVEELLAQSRVLDSMEALADDRASFKGWNSGLRYGRGNPNTCYFKLAREKLSKRFLRESTPLRECAKCGEQFTPDRKARKYCPGCAKTGRPKELPLSAQCKECSKEFPPTHTGHVYCGTACSAVAGSRVASEKPKESKLDVAKLTAFSEMFRRGDPMGKMCEVLGVSLAALKRWRKALNLPPRPSGNHSRPSKGGNHG